MISRIKAHTNVILTSVRFLHDSELCIENDILLTNILEAEK